MGSKVKSADGNLYPGGLTKESWQALKKVMSGKSLLVVFSSLMLILMGSASRGELVLFAVMLWKNWDGFYFLSSPENMVKSEDASQVVEPKNNASSPQAINVEVISNITEAPMNAVNEFLKDYCLQDVYVYVPVSLLVSYVVFLGVGGYLQWYYYIQRRDRPEEWKCQPKRFLTAENERHEFLLGAGCLLVAGTLSGVISTYVANGGTKTQVYFDVNDYGWIYFFLSTIGHFLLQDAASYYYHRMLHLPFFYRNFHKWHHGYHSPTAFSAVAMHPLESTVFQILLLLPLFFLPLHFMSAICCFGYLYYFGLIDHSGIDMDSIWPWQPPVRFHDDHHKYFHVNFGFNTLLFDRLHDTLRRKDRRYGEDIFYGKGVALQTKKD